MPSDLTPSYSAAQKNQLESRAVSWSLDTKARATPVPHTATATTPPAPSTKAAASTLKACGQRTASPAPSQQQSLRRPAAPAFPLMAPLLHHKIHKLTRHHNYLHHRFAFNPRLHLLVSQSRSLNRRLIASRWNLHHTDQLPIHLHRYLNLILLRKLRVRHRPGRAKHHTLAPNLLPHLRCKERRKGSQQQNQTAKHLGNHRRRNLARIDRCFIRRNLIDQNHDRRDRCIEVPPPIKILCDLRNRLVKLPQKRLVFGRILPFPRSGPPRPPPPATPDLYPAEPQTAHTSLSNPRHSAQSSRRARPHCPSTSTSSRHLSSPCPGTTTAPQAQPC